MSNKILSFAEVLRIVVHECTYGIPNVNHKHRSTVKKITTVDYMLKMEYIESYGLVIDLTTIDSFAHIIQILESDKMLFDVYNDNLTGYNNVLKYTSFPPKSEEEFFQASTVADLWFTLEDALTLLDLKGKEANEFANRIT